MEELSELVKAARRGNSRAFGRLVERFQDLAFGIAYARSGDFHLAQDAVQEAFIEAYRSLGTLRRPEAFGSWLRVIVLRQVGRLAGAFRKTDAPLESAAGLAWHGAGPETAVLQMEQERELWPALAGLPEGQREVVALFYLDERSGPEIARLLDLPLTTVKKRLHDGRRRLRGGATRMDETIREHAPSRKRSVAGAVELIRAVETRDAGRVRDLLLADAALVRGVYRHQDPRGETLLHVAVAGDGAPETPEYLAVLLAVLEAGAAINARGYPDNNEGATALAYAAWANKPVTVSLLLERGADPELADERGLRAIDRATRPDRREIFELLAAAGARFTLHHAVKAGLLQRVREALDRDPTLLNAADDGRSTPLHLAFNAPDVLRLLLERGADLSARDGRGRMPLHCALENADANNVPTITERKPAVDLLLAAGAPVDLHAAAGLRDLDRAEEILDTDPAQARLAQADGVTPLFFAARFGDERIVRRLLDCGADPNAFAERWWMDHTPLLAAVRAGHEGGARLLLEHGAEPDRQNALGYTALICAVRWRHEKLARLLLDLGARLDLRDRSGVCALDWAAWTGSAELVRLLIGRGADPRAKAPDESWSGRTALHFSAEHGRTEAARVLVEAGADLTAADRNGRTPLEVAEAAGQEETASYLRSANSPAAPARG